MHWVLESLTRVSSHAWKENWFLKNIFPLFFLPHHHFLGLWVRFLPGAGILFLSILSNVSLKRSLEDVQHYCFFLFKSESLALQLRQNKLKQPSLGSKKELLAKANQVFLRNWKRSPKHQSTGCTRLSLWPSWFWRNLLWHSLGWNLHKKLRSLHQ